MLPTVARDMTRRTWQRKDEETSDIFERRPFGVIFECVDIHPH